MYQAEIQFSKFQYVFWADSKKYLKLQCININDPNLNILFESHLKPLNILIMKS